MGDKIGAADKQNIEAAIAGLRQALNSDNTADIKAKTESLQQAAYKIAEEMYKQQGAQAGADPNAGSSQGAQAGTDYGTSGSKTGTADDVDYEVVNDDNDK